MGRYPAGDSGGTASIGAQIGDRRAGPRTYDFSGGPDEAAEPVEMSLPRWPGLMAHTRHGDDAIYLQAGTLYGPDEPVDMRCSGCVAVSTVALAHTDKTIVFIIGHGGGCQAVEDLLTMAGVS
jgi:hypothetical protein